jgi:hypothetical protein
VLEVAPEPRYCELANEMHRVLRAGREAVILDLRKDTPRDDIDACVRQRGCSPADAWITRWTSRPVSEAGYPEEEAPPMARQSGFGGCRITVDQIGLAAALTKTPEATTQH